MAAPGTAREALIAEILGDLGALLARVEALPALVRAADERLMETARILDSASDKYRMTVTAFNEQAKLDLAEYLNHKAAAMASMTVEEQRAAMQEAARMAFRSEASEKSADLGKVLGDAARAFRRSRWSRLVEHAVTALVASGFTAGMVYVILSGRI